MPLVAPPLRVLVVDDERLIADTLALILQAHGYNVRQAYSGEDAVSLAERFVPHAVVSDVVMPGMNGIDLAIWFSFNCPNAKMLLVSGKEAAVPMLEASSRRGYTHTILAKPVHPTEILNFVATCAGVA
jgi:DNA-binding response OmpR family regulator